MVSQSIKFKTTDGEEFDTQEEALEHEQVHEAERKYKEAVKELEIAITGKLKTADGHPFTISGYSEYWYILGRFYSDRPTVKRVVVDKYNFELINDNYGKIKGVKCDWDEKKELAFDIEYLYVSEKKAWEKVIDILKERKRSIDDYENKIKEHYL